MLMFSLIDNVVPSSCSEMSYSEETPSDAQFQAFYYEGADYIDYYQGCFTKGARLLYKRVMTHFGTCSAKLPCSLTSSEDTLIYESVCV